MNQSNESTEIFVARQPISVANLTGYTFEGRSQLKFKLYELNTNYVDIIIIDDMTSNPTQNVYKEIVRNMLSALKVGTPIKS